MPESESPKKQSPNEILKADSNYLRGTIKESLASSSNKFTGDEANLLKHHGTYQQDDRDLRQKLLAEKKEPAYSMMVRTKVPGGYMTAEQYLAHDDIASEYGNNTLRITTRQGFQFHGILKKNLKTVIREINEKLVTTLGACGDNVRNVLCCPAPLENRLKVDILKYAKAVSDQFLSKGGAYYEIWLNGEKVELDNRKPEEVEPIYGKTYLPRKFKIAFAFPDDNCVDIYTNDIGIVPEIENNQLTGFNILVGGGMGMTHGVESTYPRLASHFCFVKPDDILGITKAIVLTQRDFGNRADRKRARMKYLIDEKGLDWFRAEVEKRYGKKTEPMHPISWKPSDNHLGWHKQIDNLWFLGISVENGRVKDDGKMRLRSGLRTAVEKFKTTVYLTAQHDVILAGIPEAKKKEVEELLRSHGVKLPWELSNIQKDSMACPALPTCGLAITESERALPSVIDELEVLLKDLGLADQRIFVRMTGCPNGCARPYNAEIAFVGRTVGTYNVYLGANLVGDKMNELIGEKVPFDSLVKFVAPILKLYREKRQKEEGFGDFCSRFGIDQIRALAKNQG